MEIYGNLKQLLLMKLEIYRIYLLHLHLSKKMKYKMSKIIRCSTKKHEARKMLRKPEIGQQLRLEISRSKSYPPDNYAGIRYVHVFGA